MATESTSSKYDHITSKVLVHSGPPAVYQLKPKTENIGTIKKMTLGEKNPNKTNKTILLVGETGTGKSTLVNTLVNYAMGVKWEDDVWFEIVEDEKRSQSESQTSDVIVYQIFGFEDKTLPYSLTIIDTPGYGSTGGTDQDDIVSQRLLDLFRSDEGVHEINAVGLVLKASENQVSDRLSYIFDSVTSVNIVSLITHSDGVTPENVLQDLKAANIKCAKDEEGEPVHFMFNNHQKKKKTEKNKVALKFAWDLTTDGMNQFTDFLKKTTRQHLMTTAELVKERVRLTGCIQTLRARIKLTEQKQNEIKQTQEALRNHEEEMKNDKNFTVEVDEVHKDKETIDGGMWGLKLFGEGAVCCTVCEENCHYPGCTAVWTPQHCEVMKKGRCTSCRGKCPASDHVKEKWIYVNKTRKVQRNLQDVKDRYETSKADGENLLENLEKQMEEHEKEKDQMLEKSFKYIVTLEQIALNTESLSANVHMDFLIEKMEARGDKEKVQKLVEMKSRADKEDGARAGLWYKLTTAGKIIKEALKN